MPRLPDFIKQRCPHAKQRRALFSRCSVSSGAPSAVISSKTSASEVAVALNGIIVYFRNSDEELYSFDADSVIIYCLQTERCSRARMAVRGQSNEFGD